MTRVSAGRTPGLMPGPARRWRDAHLHLYAHGEQAMCVRLDDCPSLEACLRRLAGSAPETPPGGWVKAALARPAAWPERRFPTAREIDGAVGDRPAFVRSFDLHACAASSAALRLAGIDRHTPDPLGGRIERDARGEPTGVLIETASWLLRSAIPERSEDERREIVRGAIHDLYARGFGEVHDMLAQPWLGPTIASLIDEGDGATNAMRFLLYAPLEEIEAAWAASSAWERGNLRLGGGKVFLDGTLNSRTAWLLSGYAEPAHENSPRGAPLFTDDALDAAIRRADDRGFPLAMHAIGDGAVRQGLDALERVRPRSPGWRIEHCQFVHEADAPRFGRLGVIASPQPCHLLADVEALERFTPHLLGRAFPLRDLLDGARAAGRDPAELVWIGSDTPVVRPSVEDNVQASVERRRAGEAPGRAIGPDQAITRAEAEACMRVVH